MDPLNYHAILEKIFALSKGRTAERTLSNMERLCALYNHPEKAFPTIHVAGTNGKGSVCTKIASALQKQGYKTGLYTSPHITSYRERIQINGVMISEEEIVSLYQPHEGTFFEITTLLAFLHFQAKQVDIAVIETGLGGRLDATNVITPLLSIITSIGFDHTEILGPTLTDIANEKAGIIKSGIPVVIGPDVPYNTMKKNSPLYQSTFQSPDFDQENREIARLALSLLTQFTTSHAALEEGLKAMPPCRFERFFHKKEIILDVAHNAHGFARLIEKLKAAYPNYNYRFVVGFSEGKDIEECLKLLHPYAIHIVGGSHPRLAKAEVSVQDGIENALNTPSNKQEVVVVAGSFFIMNEAKKFLVDN